MGSHPGPSEDLEQVRGGRRPPSGLLINRDASPCDRAQGCFVTSPPPSLVLWLPNISHKHTRTYVQARTDPYAVHSTRNEDKRLEFWHQTSSRWPATASFFSTHRSLTGLFSSWNQKTKPGPLPLFFLLGNKNKLNGKTQVFFILFFFKFKAQCLSIFQSVCLSPLPGSVCEHRVT